MRMARAGLIAWTWVLLHITAAGGFGQTWEVWAEEEEEEEKEETLIVGLLQPCSLPCPLLLMSHSHLQVQRAKR